LAKAAFSKLLEDRVVTEGLADLKHGESLEPPGSLTA